MEKGYHKGQELTMSELGLSLEDLAGQPLELIAGEGAKLLLMVGLFPGNPELQALYSCNYNLFFGFGASFVQYSSPTFSFDEY